MDKQRYKGRSNYETWIIRLQIITDEALYLNALGIVESASATTELAHALKEQHQIPPQDSVLIVPQDVNLDVVDWLEIEEAVLDDANAH